MKTTIPISTPRRDVSQVLVHPDKCKLEKAAEAFQVIVKAYNDTKDPNYQDKQLGTSEAAHLKIDTQAVFCNNVQKMEPKCCEEISALCGFLPVKSQVCRCDLGGQKAREVRISVCHINLTGHTLDELGTGKSARSRTRAAKRGGKIHYLQSYPESQSQIFSRCSQWNIEISQKMVCFNMFQQTRRFKLIDFPWLSQPLADFL